MSKEWYNHDVQKILKQFNVSADRGLTKIRVEEYKKQYGENILSEENKRTIFDIFIDQFKSPLIYVLLFALVIVTLLGDFLESIIIAFVILLNSIIGTIQEGKAQNTLSALKKLVKSYVTVLRDGIEQRVPDYELVPGDIILLKDGEAVGADARLIESNFLKVNESSLTGESNLVLKISEPISGLEVGLGDRINMVFRGTYVVSGLAKAVVVDTGLNTVVGKIAKRLTGLQMDVPLKKNISNLSKVIVWSVLFLCVIIFANQMARGFDFINSLKIVVAVSVSAIPEGLPVVVTLVLASGVWRMSKQNVLVKNLQAVEALGQAKVIALDKTGTITKNQMTVEKIFFDNKLFTVSGAGYEPKGSLIFDNKVVNHTEYKGMEFLFLASSLTAIAEFDKKNQDWNLTYGDPTEASLIILAKKFGYDRKELLNKYPKILEIPFDMENKHHSIVNKFDKNKKILFTAGGPELILKKCQKIWLNGKTKKITSVDIKNLENQLSLLMSDGYRILALAMNQKATENIDAKNLPEMTFIGFVGITDAIRPEVKESVLSVRNAGMKVVMITGDHIDTATAIAKKVSIFQDGDEVLSGSQIQNMSDEQLSKNISNVTVYARVTPNDKLRIIEAYKKRGETIAMTGDGVNDALSLVAADLGVAMGKIGTEVAREASDIILLDDKFGNIVNAAEEGRNIYLTIKKTILYLLSTGLGEIMAIMIAIAINIPLPLLPAQIIWLNLVTGSILVAGLVFDPKDKNIMKDSFKKPSKYIIDFNMGIRIFIIAITISITTVILFSNYFTNDIVKAWTMSLAVLSMLQWYNIFNVRSEKKTIFSKETFTNIYLWIGLFIVLILQLFAIYNPFMQKALNLTALGLGEWAIIIVVGLIIVLVEEIRKSIYRNFVYKKAN
ncbi:MAG TPA: cation-translocating P-type ATPase [Candidatus Paceibacterota bacterium]|nr:cation-translocating P-type ATPase [Candidatus Paceibacterota bacterium]HMP18903.1 cation-translocating P-type ATPase [Candidatus Paceibacterota bacterium]HMP85064.1 cation-translocating P-type ATPase [Candidatus Paceibacterota bacterium]